MQIYLNFVVLFPFALCKLNVQNCEGNSESEINHLCLNYVRNIEGCHPKVQEDRLTFVNCSDNDIDYMADYIKTDAKDVTIIDMSHLKLQSIDKIDFQQSGKLKKLVASGNELKVFPTVCISTATAIEEIDLSSNRLTKIDFGHFIGINKLITALNFSANQVTDVEDSAFINFEQLKYVDLSKNQLKDPSDISFCRTCVVSLHLEGNPIPILAGYTFPIMDNTLVYATWDTIKQIDLEHSDPGRFRVILDDENGAIFGKSDGDSQYELHCGEQSFKIVQSLSLLEDQMENLPILLQCLTSSIQELQLSGNYLGSLNRTVFQRFENLQALFVAKTQLAEFDFSLITGRIMSLDLSFNDLTSLTNVAKLEEFLTLQVFQVSGNKIQNIPDLIRYLPSSLYLILDMSENPIGPLNATTFEHLTNLRNLKLRNTQISLTNFNPFKRLKDLRILDIANNNLNEVNFTVLADTLHQLDELYASNCQIQNVSEVIQHLGDGIKQLDLSRNLAPDLNANLFLSFTSLDTLNLNHTNITHIPPEIFKYLIYMKKIDISNNRLRALEFEKKWALSEMDVSNNCFTANYVMHLKQNLNLRDIQFSTNPFQQKSKEECRDGEHARQMPYSQYSNESKTWIIITAVISVVALIILCVCLIYRERFIGKLKTMLERSNKTAIEPGAYQCDQRQSITTAEVVTMDEPFYEELDVYVRYDKLWHEFQPMPLSKQTVDTYDTKNNSTIQKIL